MFIFSLSLIILPVSYSYRFSIFLLDSSLVSNMPREFKMDFDLVMKNIRELNILAGEGCSDVTRTKDGARLKVH